MRHQHKDPEAGKHGKEKGKANVARTTRLVRERHSRDSTSSPWKCLGTTIKASRTSVLFQTPQQLYRHTHVRNKHIGTYPTHMNYSHITNTGLKKAGEAILVSSKGSIQTKNDTKIKSSWNIKLLMSLIVTAQSGVKGRDCYMKWCTIICKKCDAWRCML